MFDAGYDEETCGISDVVPGYGETKLPVPHQNPGCTDEAMNEADGIRINCSRRQASFVIQME
jgi:hypothetical protein